MSAPYSENRAVEDLKDYFSLDKPIGVRNQGPEFYATATYMRLRGASYSHKKIDVTVLTLIISAGPDNFRRIQEFLDPTYRYEDYKNYFEAIVFPEKSLKKLEALTAQLSPLNLTEPKTLPAEILTIIKDFLPPAFEEFQARYPKAPGQLSYEKALTDLKKAQESTGNYRVHETCKSLSGNTQMLETPQSKVSLKQ